MFLITLLTLDWLRFFNNELVGPIILSTLSPRLDFDELGILFLL